MSWSCWLRSVRASAPPWRPRRKPSCPASPSRRRARSRLRRHLPKRPRPHPSRRLPPPTWPAPDCRIPARPELRVDHGRHAPATARQPSSTLGDALGSRPGIAATTFAPGASRPVIRGLSGFRVRIQENGLATGDVSALSDDHAVPIDPLAADQVEVVRGPATLRYGSQAIGGVVNAVNNRIPTAIPHERHPGRDARRVQHGGPWGRRCRDRGEPAPAISSSMPTRSRGRPATTASPAGLGQHQSREQRLLARRLLRVQGRLPGHGVFIVRLHLLHPRHRGGRQQEPHRSQSVEVGQQGRVARQRLRPGGRPLLVRRHRLQARRGGFHSGHRHRLDLPADDLRGAHGGPAPARQDFFGRAARRSRRAVVGSRSAGGRGGRHPPRPHQHAKPRRFRLRGVAGYEETAVSGRRAHRERRRQGHGFHVSPNFPAATR